MLTKSRDNDEVININKTLMVGISDGYLTTLPVNILDNLAVLLSNIDFEDFAKYLYKVTNSEKRRFFIKLIYWNL